MHLKYCFHRTWKMELVQVRVLQKSVYGSQTELAVHAYNKSESVTTDGNQSTLQCFVYVEIVTVMDYAPGTDDK